MKKNKILTAVFVFGCVLALALAWFITLFAKDNFGNKELICKGIKIGSVDVGGMNSAQAQKALSDYISNQKSRIVNIVIDDDTLETTCSELGISYDAKDYVKKALAVGKTGNLFQRLGEIRKAESGKRSFVMDAQTDEAIMEDFINTKCSEYNVKAKDSKLKMVHGKITATKERAGEEIQVKETLSNLKTGLDKATEKGSITIKAVVKKTQPKYTQEDMSKSTDVLAKYSTTYATYQVERSANIANAVHYINGTTLYPGETFSTVATIKDRTIKNGYKLAPEYSSGKVVPGVGGGVCQVSTTLYNAVINAELKVVQRSPHSMVVAYVDKSRDAAISGNYKDFKFKNNTDAPVYIKGKAKGGVITFKIFGHETRAKNRTISFESEVTDTIEPGKDVEVVDATKPASYREVTQYAHVGYKAKLWKLIFVDGIQKKKVLLNESSYGAAPQYVTVGKKPEPSATPNPSGSPKATKAPAASKATKMPATTKKPAKKK